MPRRGAGTHETFTIFDVAKGGEKRSPDIVILGLNY
jgi:hypothetical protein